MTISWTVTPLRFFDFSSPIYHQPESPKKEGERSTGGKEKTPQKSLSERSSLGTNLRVTSNNLWISVVMSSCFNPPIRQRHEGPIK
ncbi:hypothetical protein T07_14810 [Trichinella nelsoni]|uniref:Uncharacterized protein n=1 Tax=Trichinella nelsoni TaxID=6336 RepID=A0A0V0RMW8_9BILA|nr:hypothetical protein T07_14810 [Trichinella nelsoni]